MTQWFVATTLVVLNAFPCFCQLSDTYAVEPMLEGQDSAIATESLNLRVRPSLDSDVIRVMPEGTRLVLLEKTASSQTIEGISAVWCRVEDAAGDRGWCFGGYLSVYPHEQWTWYSIRASRANKIGPFDTQRGKYAMTRVEALSTVVLALPHTFQISSTLLVDSGMQKVGQFVPLQILVDGVDLEQYLRHGELGAFEMGHGAREPVWKERFHWAGYDIQYTIGIGVEGGPKGTITWYPNTFSISRLPWTMAIVLYEGLPQTTIAELRGGSPRANRALFLQIARSISFSAALPNAPRS